MNIQDIKRRLYTLLVAGINVLVQVGMLGYVWYHFYNPIIRIPFWTKGHWYILTLYCLVLVFFIHVYGGFRIGYLKRWDALLSQVFATLCSNVVFYAEIALLAYHFPSPRPLIRVSLLMVFFEFVWLHVTTRIYSMCFPPHEVLLLYGREKENEARQKLGERKDKFKIIKALNIDGDWKLIEAQLGKTEAVVLWDIPNAARNKVLKLCYGKHIRIYSMPSISDIVLSGAEMMHFFDTPLFLVRSNPMTIEQQVVKRMLDLAFAVILLVILWPVMVIAAVCIKLYDGGPVLYKQIRCTLYGREFYIYKFRSMIVNAEKDGKAKLAEKHDSRITPVGRLIRKTRIDELPQLFNVLKGDMSFVGPRPERPEILKEYQKDLPEFSYRMNVKAGLTGYAQIYGKYNTVPYDKLKLDLYYVEHYSLWQDIKLLILTTKIVFSPESTEGVEKHD